MEEENCFLTRGQPDPSQLKAFCHEDYDDCAQYCAMIFVK